MSLSFFAHKTISGNIRGGQMAKWTGSKLNPKGGFENDTCIFVKYPPFHDVKKFFDIIDCTIRFKWIKQNPECPLIAISETSQEYFREQFKNPVTLIPQHHINFNREKRVRTEVKVVGFCGEDYTFQPFEKEFREKLAKIGLELNAYYAFNNRKNVLDFYRSIDIQIIWRHIPNDIPQLRNPLKLSNAGSFFIPTVTFPEISFVREYGGCFLPAYSIDEMVSLAGQLRDDDKLYLEMASKAWERAERYHIEHIAKLYKRL